MRHLLIFCFLGLLLFTSCGPKETTATISTEYGDIVVKLYDETPLHKENFIKLANEGYYDGTLFHRVINQFMIQGGDPDSKGAAAGQRLGMGGPGYTIPAEIGAPHIKGALAAARTGGPSNPEKRSSGSQFYIVHGKKVTDGELTQMASSKNFTYTPEQKKKYLEMGGTPFLDNDYTVYGEVISGLDVVDKIAAVQKDGGDRPNKDVAMTVKMN